MRGRQRGEVSATSSVSNDTCPLAPCPLRLPAPRVWSIIGVAEVSLYSVLVKGLVHVGLVSCAPLVWPNIRLDG